MYVRRLLSLTPAGGGDRIRPKNARKSGLRWAQ